MIYGQQVAWMARSNKSNFILRIEEFWSAANGMGDGTH